MSCPEPHVREELGAYALGLSEPEDRAAVERHLETCPSCRAELDDLKGVVSALGALPQEAVEELREPPEDPLLERLAEARRRERRSLRVARGAGGAGLVGLLAAGVLAFDLARRPVDPTPPEGSPVTWQAEGSAPARGTTVRVTAREAGTQIDLETDALPPVGPDGYYKLWLIDPAGRKIGVGTFRPERDGETEVRVVSAEPLEAGTKVGLTRGEDDLLLVGAPRPT